MKNEIKGIRNECENKTVDILNSKIVRTPCGDCWGSGWEIQFVKPCEKCNGTGVKN